MISLAFDGVIAVLLLVTITFCILLCRRLRTLKADEEMMRSVVSDIVQSTGKAEHAIRTLKATAEECEHTIGTSLRDAEALSDALTDKSVSADAAVRRLAEVVALAQSARLFEKRSRQYVPPAANETVDDQLLDDAAVIADAPAPRPAAASALATLRARAA